IVLQMVSTRASSTSSPSCADAYCAMAGDEARLEGLIETGQLSTFVVTETAAQDLNGDGAIAGQQIVTLRERATGASVPIGPPGLCPGLPDSHCTGVLTDLVEVQNGREHSFDFPPVTAERDVLAFLEARTPIIIQPGIVPAIVSTDFFDLRAFLLDGTD